MKAKSGKVFRQAAILAVCILPLWSQPVLAERIKDLASIQGVRSNQLLGNVIALVPPLSTSPQELTKMVAILYRATVDITEGSAAPA